MTGLVRHTIRAVAGFDDRPSSVLQSLNRALLGEAQSEQFCTVVVVALEYANGELRATVASGGHPLPLLVSPTGEVTTVGTPGYMVGAFPKVDFPEQTVFLRPAQALVMFTDGVLERREGLRFLGNEGLRSVVSDVAGGRADEIAGAIADAVARFQPEAPMDDMAVLALRREGEVPGGTA